MLSCLPGPSSSKYPGQQQSGGGDPPVQSQPLPRQPRVPGQPERLPGWAQMSAVRLCARYACGLALLRLPTATWRSWCVCVCVCGRQGASWVRLQTFWCSWMLVSRCQPALVLLAATRCADVVPAVGWRTVWRCPAWTSTSPAWLAASAKVRTHP